MSVETVSTLNEVLVPIVISVLGTLLSALTALGLAYLNKLKVKVDKETEAIANKDSREFMKSVVDSTYDTIMKAVKITEQKFIPTIKAAYEDDGKLSKEDQQKALDYAKDLTKELLGTTGLNNLKKVIADYDKYITSLVDSAVKDMNNQRDNNTTVIISDTQIDHLNS